MLLLLLIIFINISNALIHSIHSIHSSSKAINKNIQPCFINTMNHIKTHKSSRQHQHVVVGDRTQKRLSLSLSSSSSSSINEKNNNVIKMNIPNILTISRIVMIPFFIISTLNPMIIIKLKFNFRSF